MSLEFSIKTPIFVLSQIYEKNEPRGSLTTYELVKRFGCINLVTDQVTKVPFLKAFFGCFKIFSGKEGRKFSRKIQPALAPSMMTTGVMIQKPFTGRQAAPIPKNIKIVHTGAPDYEGVSSTNNMMNTCRIGTKNVHIIKNLEAVTG